MHALHEFERFYNDHRPHQGIANAIVSAASSTSTNMPLELPGWDFRQAQGQLGLHDIRGGGAPHELVDARPQLIEQTGLAA
jgi:hypothetical protein